MNITNTTQGNKRRVTAMDLINMPRAMRRMIGKANGIKIPGIQDFVKQKGSVELIGNTLEAMKKFNQNTRQK